jgi:type I restriction enzyme, S subunit
VTDQPTGWAQAAVGDIAELADGPFGSNLKTAHYTEDGPRVVRLQNIGDGVFRDERAHITEEHYERLIKHAVRPGDIAAASLGEDAPRACLIPSWLGPAVVKADCIRVRTLDGIDSAFLMWMLNSPPVRAQAASSIKGVGRPRLGLGGLKRLGVPIPPLEEQRRIVRAIDENFSRLDAAEGLLRRAAARTRVLRDAVYTAAVAGSWPATQLETLLREALRNGHSAKASPDGTGIRALTLSAVTYADFSDENTKMTTADPARVKDLWLEPGDILIERSNTPDLVGTAALYRGSRNWAIFPDLLIRVRVSEAIRPEFLEIVLKARPARQYFQRAAEGIAGSMPKIDQDDVSRLPVPLPERDEQDTVIAAVDRQLSLVDAMAAETDVAVHRSAALRRSILEQAFTGRLVPQDASDEPASTLLERIAARQAANVSSRGTVSSRRVGRSGAT